MMLCCFLMLLLYCVLAMGLPDSCSAGALYDYVYCVSSDSACSQCLSCYNNASLFIPFGTQHARLCNDTNEPCAACSTHCSHKCSSSSLIQTCPSLSQFISPITHIELTQTGNRSAVDFEYQCDSVDGDQLLRIKYAILSPVSLDNVSSAYLDRCTIDFSTLLASKCERAQCSDVNILSTLTALAASCTLNPAMFKSQIGVYCMYAEPPTYNRSIPHHADAVHNHIPLSDAVVLSLLSVGAIAVLLVLTLMVWFACKHVGCGDTGDNKKTEQTHTCSPVTPNAPRSAQPRYEAPSPVQLKNKRRSSNSDINLTIQAIPTTHEATHTRDASELINTAFDIPGITGELGARGQSMQARDQLQAWKNAMHVRRSGVNHLSPQSRSASHGREYDECDQPTDLSAIRMSPMNISTRMRHNSGNNGNMHNFTHNMPMTAQFDAGRFAIPVYPVQPTENDVLANTLMFPNDDYYVPFANYTPQGSYYAGPGYDNTPTHTQTHAHAPGQVHHHQHHHAAQEHSLQQQQQQQQYAAEDTANPGGMEFPDFANPLGDLLAFGGSPPDMFDETKIELITQAEYHFDAEIGGGTCARVFKGRWRNQEVAVKRFNKNLGVDAQAAKRYISSCAMKLCENTHNNVIRIFAYGTEPFTLLTEYMNYGSVKRFVRRSRPGSTSISILDRIEIGLQAADGLAHLHSLDIVHTEINCQNLLMGHMPDLSVRVVLSDFGIPLVLSEDAAETYRASLANIKWLAPECIEVHEHKTMHYTKEADVYAYGVTLWEIITGQDPYPDISPVDTAVHVYVKERRPQSYAFIPETIQQLMKVCWHKTITDRPPAEQVVQTLREFITHERRQIADDGNHL